MWSNSWSWRGNFGYPEIDIRFYRHSPLSTVLLIQTRARRTSGRSLANMIIHTYDPYCRYYFSHPLHAVIASYARYVSISQRGMTRVLVDDAMESSRGVPV